MKGFTKGIVFPVLVFLLLSGCSIDEPVLPKWVVPIVIPIGKEKVILQEELPKDSTIVSEGDSLSIHFEDQFDPQSISQEDLSFPGENSSTTLTLEDLQIDSLNTMNSEQIELSELMPLLQTLVGQTFTIPETTLTASPAVVTSDEFKGIHLESGVITLTIHNDLPFPIGPNSFTPNGTLIKIFDDSTGTLITEIQIPDEIPPGEVGRGSAPLTNQGDWIRPKIRLDYQLPIARATSIQVTQEMLNTAGFHLGMSMSDLAIAEIIGKVDAQQFSDAWKVNFGQDDEIVRAKVSGGSVQLQLHNQFPLGATVHFKLPDVKDASGQTYQDQVVINPSSTVNKNIDLRNFTIESSEVPGQALDGLRVTFEVATQETQGFVHVKKTDLIQTDITTSRLQFSDLEGYLSPDTLNIDSFEENDIADYKNFESGFKFHDAQLQLALQNQIEIDNLSLNLEITGYHKNESGAVTDSATIHVQEALNASPQDTIILEGEDVVNFLNILPTDVKGGGFVAYSGRAHINVGDQIQGSYAFSTPLKFEIVNPAPIEIDPDTLTADDIDQDLRDAVGDEIQYARLHATVENHSPIGGTVQIFISNDLSRNDFYDPNREINPDNEFVKSISIQGAPVSSSTGFVKQTIVSQVDFELTTSQLRLFKEPPLMVGYRILLNETNGPVVLKGSDFVEISGKVEVQLLVKDEK